MKNKITPKTFLLFLLSAGLIIVLITTCKKPDMLFHADGSIAGSGLLAGAVFYDGPLPAVGLVTYMDGSQQVTDSAYLGRVIVFFNLPISEEDAIEIITEKGGSILEKIPNVGDYLVQVPQGQEGSYINAMNSNPSVYLALPHVLSYYMSSGVTVIDNCGKQHGNRVQQTLEECGGSIDACKINATGNSPDDIKTKRNIYSTVANTFLNKKNATLINISSSANNLQEWKDALITKLIPIAQMVDLNPKYAENLVITISAGNHKLDVTTVLNEIRNLDPGVADILSNNILIVGASGIGCSTFPPPYTGGSNFINASAVNESDFVYMTTCKAPDSVPGTSFSAPQLMCLIQKIMNEKGLKASEALHIVKLAAFNNNHIVDQTQVLDIANNYNSACGAQTQSGGAGVTTTTIKTLGSTSGTVTIDYEMYSVPDQIYVSINGNVVAGTGFVSGAGTLSFTYNASSLYYINVVVTGSSSDTQWYYTVNCPE